MVVLVWAVLATLRRMLALVLFFVPSLGLLDLLHHWQAEQRPFWVRREAAARGEMSPGDTLQLFNMSAEVRWSELDRWSYGAAAQPPHYSLYTGLSLENTFIAFHVIFALHCVFLAVVKYLNVENFLTRTTFHDAVHVIENVNIPFPYRDWDSGSHRAARHFRLQWRRVNKEMAATFAVNFLFTIIMFAPFWWTGEGNTIKYPIAHFTTICLNSLQNWRKAAAFVQDYWDKS